MMIYFFSYLRSFIKWQKNKISENLKKIKEEKDKQLEKKAIKNIGKNSDFEYGIETFKKCNL